MKPTRGLPATRLQRLPRERRIALGSLALLLTLMGSLVLYQRFAVPEAPQPLPGAQVPEHSGETPVAGDAAEQPETVGEASAPPPELARPLAGQPTVLQGYDYLYSDTFGDYRLHPGLDYAVAAGDPVMAAGPGTVVRIEDDPVEGRILEIDHGHGLVTRYGGLGAVAVGRNAIVQSGTVIGQMGSGDQVRLHFEVLVDGAPVNPSSYLKP